MKPGFALLFLASCSPFELPKPEQHCWIIDVQRNTNGNVIAFVERCAGSDKLYKVKEVP